MDTAQTPKTTMRDFLYLIFKRKTQILIFFVATVFTVALGTYLSVPTYQAESQILVRIGRENLYMPTVPTSANQNAVINVNREEQINSEIEILTSRALLKKVLETIGPDILYKDLERKDNRLKGILSRFTSSTQKERLSPLQEAVPRLQKDLSVEAVKKSNVINITLKHKDPQMAAMVLNKLVDLYMDHHLEVYKSPQSYKFFQEQSQNLMGKLKKAEDRLEAFKKQHNVTSLDEERRLLLSEEGALRTELNRTLSQVAETENRMVQIQRQLADTPKTVPMEEEVEHSPYVINTLQARLMELELKQKELLLKYSEESRWVMNVIEEIKMVKEKLTEQETKRYGKSRSGVNTTHQRLQEELYRNQAEMKALKAKEETQTSQLVYHRERLGKLNGIEVELKGLQRQVDVDQQNYRLYLMKFEESRISDAMDTEKMTSVTQIEPATRPLKPVSPKVMQNLILGILLGALGGFGLAFLMEYLDESMEKPEDVEAALNLPVLASIPVEIIPKDLGVASGRWSLGSRYYLGAGLGLAPCAIVGLVLLGGESFFGQKENAAFPGLDRFQATITDQPGIVKKSLGLTPPDAHALQEVSGPAQPQSADSSKPVKIPDEPNSENQTRDMSAGPKNQLHASATNPVSLQKPDLQISEKTLQPSRLIDETSKVEGLSIQLGAFREESSANEVMKKLQTLGYSPHLDMRPLKNQSLIRRVLLKGFASISEASATMDRLKKQGFPDVFIPQPDRNLQRTASAANPVPLPGPSFQIAQKPAQPSPSIPETPKMGELSIQLGAFREESSAHDVMRKLQEIGYNPRLDTKTMKNQALIHRVRLKGYASRIEAGAIVVQLKKQGFPDVFIPQPEAN